MTAREDFQRAINDFFGDDPVEAEYLFAAEGTYDPATGEYTSVVISLPVKIIILDLERDNNGLSRKFGTNILAGDKECYIIPKECGCSGELLNIDTTQDKIKVNNITYKIHVMKSADPTGTDALLYNLLLRR